MVEQCVDKKGNCSVCGGTHYGITFDCPYRCGMCGVNTDHCEKPDCQRNRRWKSEEGLAPGPELSEVIAEGRSE